MMFVDELKVGIGAAMHPSKETRKQMSTKQAIAFYYKFSLIPVAIAIIIALAASALLGATSSLLGIYSHMPTHFALLSVLLPILILWVLVPVGFLINALFLQLIGRNLFNSFKGRYSNSITALVYGEMPAVGLFWTGFIPIIGTVILVIAGIWGFIVQIIALSNQQKTSRLVAFVIMIATSFLVGIIFYGIVLGGLFSLGVFNSSLYNGNGTSLGSCIPITGYTCTSPTLSKAGLLSMDFGQNLGETIYGATLTLESANGTAIASDYLGTISSGQSLPVSLSIPGSAIMYGYLNGDLYLSYSLTPSGAQSSPKVVGALYVKQS